MRKTWLDPFISLFIPTRKKPPLVASPVGECHNLHEIFHELNLTYFQKTPVSLCIIWSGNRMSRAKTAIRLGSYHHKTQTIRINRLLDQAHIPRYFVSFVLYHEVLHHLYPPILRIGKKRSIHHPFFQKKEKEFKEYAKAQEFLLQLRKSSFSSFYAMFLISLALA